jgi:hypothetical protein
LAQGVHKLPKSFAVNILDLGSDQFDAFYGLDPGKQLVDLTEGAFALLGFQFLLQLLGGLGELFDLGQDGFLTDI